MHSENSELQHYQDLLKARKGTNHVAHSPDLWDRRADSWEAELREGGSRDQRSRRRVAATVDFLQKHGALDENTHMIDIGCGLGRFDAEFGKIAADVLGVDFSEQMLRYGRQYAEENGAEHARFEICDFKNVDIDSRGWRNAFDLVFASITPAVAGQAGWSKMVEMSRAYCYLSSYVHSELPLEDQIAKDLYDMDSAHEWEGAGFYSLFNTLWLWGYFPTVVYYPEIIDEQRRPNIPLAKKLAERFCGTATDEETERIYKYLQDVSGPDGTFHYYGKWIYGWVLWDVRKCCPHSYSI